MYYNSTFIVGRWHRHNIVTTVYFGTGTLEVALFQSLKNGKINQGFFFFKLIKSEDICLHARILLIFFFLNLKKTYFHVKCFICTLTSSASCMI